MVERLSQTERAMAAMVARGEGNKQIARALHVTPRTVQNTLSAVYRLIALPDDCNKRVMLARLVFEQGRDDMGKEGP